MSLWPLALSSQFWFFAGRERESMANDQEQASACCLFFFLPSHLCLQHPGNAQETVSSSCLRKTRLYSQFMVMKSLCAWKHYSWSSLHWEDRSSQKDLENTDEIRFHCYHCWGILAHREVDCSSHAECVQRWQRWKWVELPEYAVSWPSAASAWSETIS